ncbi:hypothetical protein VTK56DRAFT_2031 [Thermocarpiscus australiensis]
MMTVPYHFLKVCGNVIFAAQGSDIHSFSPAFEHLSTWRYPVKPGDGPVPGAASPAAQESPAPEGPPAKRRRVEDGQEPASNGHTADSTNEQGKKKSITEEASNPANERPFIQGLYATTDGRHLLAITGSDKTIWVFEHDGAGNLKQLSQRAMPKRPCALALTRDNRTILSADKFGDVYALPLIPSSSPPPSDNTPLPKSRSATPAPGPLKPQANELTVHTKRNLKALEDQKLSLTRKAAQDQQQQQQRPQFEHTLLLGHVSMLTAICVGTERTSDNREREYIITTDRDEHIRVSRGIPQAHVIEGFCLGHEEFVSRLCIPPGGPRSDGILISGGGDDDLFVWDWLRGSLLCRAALLAHVRGVVGEDASKVAVTRLFACRWASGAILVFALCERVPALFCYELLDDNTLCHRETIRVPGNPLDVEVIESSGPAPRLLVAVDPSASPDGNGASLLVLDKEAEAEAGWRQSSVQNLPPAENINIGAEELQKILYTTESLRKLTDFD